LFSQFFESAKVFCARFEELRVAEARIVSNKLVNVKNMIFSFISFLRVLNIKGF
jgi:hypothetical protein